MIITAFIVGFGLGMVVGCLSWLIAAAYLEAARHQSVVRQGEEPTLSERHMAVSQGYVARHASKQSWL